MTMLKAIGKTLILRPALPHTMSDGGIHLLNLSPDECADRIYHVVSYGAAVTIQGLDWGTRVLIAGNIGRGFDWEGYPLRVVDESEILMVLDPAPAGPPHPHFGLAPGTVSIGHPTVAYPPEEPPAPPCPCPEGPA